MKLGLPHSLQIYSTVSVKTCMWLQCYNKLQVKWQI